MTISDKYRVGVGIITCAGLFVTATPPVSADELQLEPSSPWNMRYDEDKCRLVRVFGSGEDEVVLMFDQAGTEPYYTLWLIGQPTGRAQGELMRIRFGPNELASERSYIEGKLGDDRPLLAMHGINLAPAEMLGKDALAEEAPVSGIGPEREAAITQIEFGRALRRGLVLKTGSMGEPLKAMHACSTDLAKKLGIGDEMEPEGEVPPLDPNSKRKAAEALNIGKWVLPSDYPARMLERDEEGVVRFRLTVDSSGKATACYITRSTRPQVFDDAVCAALLKRAKFKPALDQNGEPIASYYFNTVRFHLP